MELHQASPGVGIQSVTKAINLGAHQKLKMRSSQIGIPSIFWHRKPPDSQKTRCLCSSYSNSSLLRSALPTLCSHSFYTSNLPSFLLKSTQHVKPTPTLTVNNKHKVHLPKPTVPFKFRLLQSFHFLTTVLNTSASPAHWNCSAGNTPTTFGTEVSQGLVGRLQTGHLPILIWLPSLPSKFLFPCLCVAFIKITIPMIAHKQL